MSESVIGPLFGFCDDARKQSRRWWIRPLLTHYWRIIQNWQDALLYSITVKTLTRFARRHFQWTIHVHRSGNGNVISWRLSIANRPERSENQDYFPSQRLIWGTSLQLQIWWVPFIWRIVYTIKLLYTTRNWRIVFVFVFVFSPSTLRSDQYWLNTRDQFNLA